MKSYKKGLFAEYFLIFLLMLKGYKIVARRFKTPVGEIDIIAVKNKQMKVFEVKYRSNKEEFNVGSLNVGNKQNRRIVNALNMFLSGNKKYIDYNISYNIFLYRNIFNCKFYS